MDCKNKARFSKRKSSLPEFFFKLRKHPYLVCPQFRKIEENDKEYRERIGLLKQNYPPLLNRYLEHFNINYEFVTAVQLRGSVSTEDILDLLDPQEEITEFSHIQLQNVLPLLFHSHGVSGFRRSRGSFDKSSLSIHERLLKIDLRKRKTQLIHEFKNYLEHELRLHAVGTISRVRDRGGKPRLGAFDWELEKGRDRKEAWLQLEVWKYRKKQVQQRRKSFKEIAQIRQGLEDTIKKRYYRAREWIYGQHCDSIPSNENVKDIEKEELIKTCAKCTDKDCQKKMKNGRDWIPCPDVQPFLDQDHVSLKEQYLKEDSDTYREYLLFEERKSEFPPDDN